MSQLTIAVIGAGLIGKKHIAHILKSPDFRLVAIADVNRDAVAALYPGVPVFADSREMMDEAKPQAVIIASPNQLHAENATDCARRGIHCIIEKPVTDSVESAQALLAEIEKSGIKTLVGHHRRHHQQVQLFREALAAGLLGAIVGVSGIWATYKPASYYEAGPWRKLKGGGVLLINLIHEIDFLRFTLGEIVTVSGMSAHRQRGFEVPDAACASLEFANGALGTFFITDSGVSPWTMEQGLGEAPEFPYSGQSSYRFIGAKGAMEWPEMRLWTHAGEPNWNTPVLARELHPATINPYDAQLAHFADVIRGHAHSLQTAADGLKTLIATAAVSEAAVSGARIDVAQRIASAL
ncbi:MAG: Gfo/Idh/MocA family oxidoreductase [Proteobacteria bacterium]|nr:Gfo/Idh/MocA family oxidoreductase [Pseudomonadota bacterium]